MTPTQFLQLRTLAQALLVLLIISIYIHQVNNISKDMCDYLYGRNVDSTGKFCAGGSVDACQVGGVWKGQF